MGDKNISKESYVWSHFGVILFHLIISGYLLYIYFSKFSLKTIKLSCLIIGGILGIVSLLSLIPIFTDYDRVKEVVIVKDD